MVISPAAALSILSNIVKLCERWSKLKTVARAEGRSISPDEMDAIQKEYELSDIALDEAIKRAEEREAKEAEQSDEVSG